MSAYTIIKYSTILCCFINVVPIDPRPDADPERREGVPEKSQVAIILSRDM